MPAHTGTLIGLTVWAGGTKPLQHPLTARLRTPTLAAMEVHFAPNTEAQLKEFAARKGKDAAQAVEETVSNMLQRQARFVEGVERGIASADRATS